MNQAMKDAWLQVVKILDQQPSREEFNAFLRTWQLAMQAEREACAKLCEEEGLLWGQRYAAAIRARGQA